MNDYMTALHQQFYREPDFSELEEEIEQTRQEVRDCLDKLDAAGGYPKLATGGNFSGSFTAGFKLAWGIVKELEADGL